MSLKDFIAKKALGAIGKKLDGYKTTVGGSTFIIGGIIAVLTALLGIIRLIFPDLQIQGIPDMTLSDCLTVGTGGIASIGTGFGMLGLGGKAEKQKAATIHQTATLTVQNELLTEQNTLLKNMQPVPLEPIVGCIREIKEPAKDDDTLKVSPVKTQDF